MSLPHCRWGLAISKSINPTRGHKRTRSFQLSAHLARFTLHLGYQPQLETTRNRHSRLRRSRKLCHNAALRIDSILELLSHLLEECGWRHAARDLCGQWRHRRTNAFYFRAEPGTQTSCDQTSWRYHADRPTIASPNQKLHTPSGHHSDRLLLKQSNCALHRVSNGRFFVPRPTYQ